MNAPSPADLAGRLNLHRVPGRREWRGACPACGYADAFVVGERAGRSLGWCASCQDREAIGGILRGGVPSRAIPLVDTGDAERRERTKARALALWNGSQPAGGTPADTYLTARALPRLAASGALRFRADCPHPAGARIPALLAVVTDAAGNPVAVHRTFLRPDGSGKADVVPNRASLGPVWGGAIRLDPAARELVIGEGIESAASAGRLLGLPAWAAISAGNLARGLVLPPEVRSVVIAADADEPGERAARDAALRWAAEGRKVRIARPDRAGHDFNDLLRAGAGVAHA